jgi:hypothetical protein
MQDSRTPMHGPLPLYKIYPMDSSPSPLAERQIRECLQQQQQQQQQQSAASPMPAVQYSRVGYGEGFVGCLWRGSYEVDVAVGAAGGDNCSGSGTRTFIAKTVPPLSGEAVLCNHVCHLCAAQLCWKQ